MLMTRVLRRSAAVLERGTERMKQGYSKPLYLLAFDHRGSFGRDLSGAP
jgi:hypothetical protein